MLEVGVDKSKSMELWKKYFPRAFIYGIDIDIRDIGDRYRIFKADQSDKQKMKKIVSWIKHPIFFIIDDGSHIPEHQVQSFDLLFDELLLPGGTYIVEDLETSYWRRNGLYGYQTRYGYGHKNSAIETFKLLVDDVNREFMSSDARAEHDRKLDSKISTRTRSLVSTISFGMNCVIITKKTKEESEVEKRSYRYAENL